MGKNFRKRTAVTAEDLQDSADDVQFVLQPAITGVGCPILSRGQGAGAALARNCSYTSRRRHADLCK